MTGLRRLGAIALIGAAAAACTQPAAGDPPRVAVVLGGRAASDPALLAQAGALATRAGGADVRLRIARTPTEELAVTHVLAAEGYDAVVGLDLDRAVSIAPVARRFPHVRFVSARPATLAATVRAQTEPRFRLR
jgi:hypothetical protein